MLKTKKKLKNLNSNLNTNYSETYENSKSYKKTKKNLSKSSKSSSNEKKSLLIITYNSPGLIMDSSIYKDIFEKNNYIVDIIILEATKDKNDNNINTNTNLNKIKKKYYANLIIEVIPYNLKINYPSKLNFFMPNSELFFQFDKLKNINYIFCKNNLAYNYFEHIKKNKNHNYKCYYTKFTTLLPEEIINQKKIIKDPNTFIHFAGKSPFKNTAYLVNCWLNNKCFLNIDPQIKLYITCYDHCFRSMVFNFKKIKKDNVNFYFQKDKIFTYKNITFFCQKAPYEQYLDILSKANVAICISSMEGYAHYINEARFLKTFVITVDAAPMNELVENNVNGYLLTDKSNYKDLSETGFELIKAIPTEENLKNIIIKCIKNKNNLYKMASKSHEMFLSDKDFLYKSMKKAILDII
jgi:glycosyltransferase involved in cell wall biosynthesis